MASRRDRVPESGTVSWIRLSALVACLLAAGDLRPPEDTWQRPHDRRFGQGFPGWSRAERHGGPARRGDVLRRQGRRSLLARRERGHRPQGGQPWRGPRLGNHGPPHGQDPNWKPASGRGARASDGARAGRLATGRSTGIRRRAPRGPGARGVGDAPWPRPRGCPRRRVLAARDRGRGAPHLRGRSPRCGRSLSPGLTSLLARREHGRRPRRNSRGGRYCWWSRTGSTCESRKRRRATRPPKLLRCHSSAAYAN